MILLPVHIVGALLGIAAGFVALYAAKGGRLHKQSGTVFVYAMIAMAASAMIMAATKGQRVNFVQGSLMLYFATTGLLAVRRARTINWLDGTAMAGALAVGSYDYALGVEAMTSPVGTVDGIPGAMMFVFGTLLLAGGAGDLRVLRGRTLDGRQRLVRHLWRMCVAALTGTASLFLGQADEIPEPLRITPVLIALAVAPLAVMLYWLVRMKTAKRADRLRAALNGDDAGWALRVRRS